MVLRSTSFVLLTLFYSSSGLSLPSDFEICKRSDPIRDECLKSAIQNALPILAKGLPDFNFDDINSIILPNMSIGSTRGVVHAAQTYKNVKLHNIPLLKIENVTSTITDTEFQLEIDGEIDKLYMTAKYNLNGSILIVPLVGKGDGTITLKKAKMKLTVIGEIFEKNGKQYIDIVKSIVVMVPGKVEFDLSNLFNGNIIFGLGLNAVLTESGKELYDEFGPGYEAALGSLLKDRSNQIFKKIPYDEIFPR